MQPEHTDSPGSMPASTGRQRRRPPPRGADGTTYHHRRPPSPLIAIGDRTPEYQRLGHSLHREYSDTRSGRYTQSSRGRRADPKHDRSITSPKLPMTSSGNDDADVLYMSVRQLASLTSIDVEKLARFWHVFTKQKSQIRNGERLEYLSWRLWFKERAKAQTRRVMGESTDSPFFATPSWTPATSQQHIAVGFGENRPRKTPSPTHGTVKSRAETQAKISVTTSSSTDQQGSMKRSTRVYNLKSMNTPIPVPVSAIKNVDQRKDRSSSAEGRQRPHQRTKPATTGRGPREDTTPRPIPIRRVENPDEGVCAQDAWVEEDKVSFFVSSVKE